MWLLCLNYINSMSANSMSANSMSANSMSANSMSANSMSANSMSANSMSANPLLYNITNVINTTLSSLITESEKNDFSASEKETNNESTIDDKSIMFITGGIFIGLFIASMAILIKSRKKENIIEEYEEPQIIHNLEDSYYEEPEIIYNLADSQIQKNSYYDNLSE